MSISEEPKESIEQSAPRAKTLPLAPPRLESIPELVPARMVNEVLYCERLMYLEWVQAEWADNKYTIDGKVVHKKVDKKDQHLQVTASSIGNDTSPPTNTVANPVVQTQETGENSTQRPYTARSVWLSSEVLGATAKIDLVDVDDKLVTPVEYKRGSCPEWGPYLPERAQVAVQALLLRAHGYECESGEIYFAKDHRRVKVELSDDLLESTRNAIFRARELVSLGKCPPPLENSPKCNGCSLSGICLPDEVRILRDDTLDIDEEEENLRVFDVGDDPWDLVGPEPHPMFTTPTRRLFPARDEKVPVYVQGQGAQVRLCGERLIITHLREKATEARIANTSSLTLYGNVQITTQVIRRLMEDGIPLLFASSGGWFTGRALGADPKNIELRAAQYQLMSNVTESLAVARCLVYAKIRNCRAILRRNHKKGADVALSELRQLAMKAKTAVSVESLLGIEGAAARAYFQAFQGMLTSGSERVFDFERRNRRPPKDPVNALLSYCYSLLTREMVLAVHAVGMDPLLGVYHQPRFGRPSLALDLMEEFRPVLADSVVISVINNGVVQKGDFVIGNGAVSIKAPARKRVILAMERRLDQLVTHPIFDYRLSYRRVLEIQARLLSRVLLGELDSYPGFVVR